MFKHILIPTDGSKLSEAALRAGIQLAREQGAQVTVLYVMPDYAALMYTGEAMMTYSTNDLNKDADAARLFDTRARHMLKNNPELTHLFWLNGKSVV